LEKIEIIKNADDILNIREIRNQIAHEYVETDLNTLFLDVLHFVPELIKMINNVKAYYREKFTAIQP